MQQHFLSEALQSLKVAILQMENFDDIMDVRYSLLQMHLHLKDADASSQDVSRYFTSTLKTLFTNGESK